MRSNAKDWINGSERYYERDLRGLPNANGQMMEWVKDLILSGAKVREKGACYHLTPLMV